jgi:hypothetical protein
MAGTEADAVPTEGRRPAKRPKRDASAAAAKFRRGEPIATRKVRLGCTRAHLQPSPHRRRRAPRPPAARSPPGLTPAATHAAAALQIEDKKLKGRLRYTEGVVREAQAAAAKVGEWLLPSEAGALEAEGLERTWRFQQAEIAAAAEAGAARKVFDLSLPELGPYSLDFTRSGRFALLGGRRGHLALLDWQRMATVTEVQVRETVRDVKFLHNETLFAAAQRQYVYVYDKRGIEVHCLKVRAARRGAARRGAARRGAARRGRAAIFLYFRTPFCRPCAAAAAL